MVIVSVNYFICNLEISLLIFMIITSFFVFFYIILLFFTYIHFILHGYSTMFL